MLKKELKKLVLEEIENIKSNTIQEKRDNLNFDKLDPYWTESCIYGQLFGSCLSVKAIEQISKLPTAIYVNTKYIEKEETNLKTYKKVPIELRVNDQYIEYHFSPLEIWIIKYPKNNQNIINYIKGETNLLNL